MTETALNSRIARILWSELHPRQQMPENYQPDPIMVASFSSNELLALDGIDKKSLREIQLWLDDRGLNLGVNSVEAMEARIKRLEDEIAFYRNLIAERS